MCLQPELERLVANVVPEERQGFWRGGRIYAAYLALHALIESARVSGERLYVAFVDVRRAFPSVRRDILWRELSALGASDDPIIWRELWWSCTQMHRELCGVRRA